MTFDSQGQGQNTYDNVEHFIYILADANGCDAHWNRRVMSDRINVAFVGGGVACGALLSTLSLSAPGLGLRRGLDVTIFEPNPNLGQGVTYGTQSGERTLTITPMAEVLPSEALEEFCAWLAKHATLDAVGSDIGARYLPRCLVGRFLEDRVRQAVARLSEFGIQVYHRQQAVRNIHPLRKKIAVTFANDTRDFDAVVLMNGTPKNPGGGAYTRDILQTGQYIPDLYAPGIEQNMERILSQARAIGPVDVLAIGTNASSAEAAYLLADAIWSKAVRFHAVSGSGRWPAILGRECAPPFGVPQSKHDAKDLAFKRSPFLAKDARLDKIRACLAEGDLDGAMDGYRAIASSLPALTAPARQDAINFLLPAVVDAIRRIGGPYADRLKSLSDAGLLSTTAGIIEDVRLASGGKRLAARLEGGQVMEADFVVDAGGWGGARRNNPLVASLLSSSAEIEMTPGERGLKVDRNFMAAPGLFVFGPLLAGMDTEHHRLWHLESTSNIHRIAQSMASSFLEFVRAI